MAETQDIKVESYQEIGFDGAWKSRSRSLWAVAILGAITGAAFGAIVPIFPLAVVAGTAAMPASMLSFFGSSVAVFAGLGMSAGFGIGVINGATSGAAASVAKEQEKRFKTLLAKNNLSIDLPPEKPQPEKPGSLFKKIRDFSDTYFNWRVAAAFAALGAASGLIMAAGGIPLHSGMENLLGKAIMANSTAVTAYFTGVMTCFGAIFGINYPKIAGKMNSVIGSLLSGEALGTQFGPKPEKTPQPDVTKEMAIPEPAAGMEKQLCCAEPNYATFQELLAKQSAESSLALKR